MAAKRSLLHGDRHLLRRAVALHHGERRSVGRSVIAN